MSAMDEYVEAILSPHINNIFKLVIKDMMNECEKNMCECQEGCGYQTMCDMIPLNPSCYTEEGLTKILLKEMQHENA